MKNLDKVLDQLKVVPKLRLGIKLEKGGMEPTGPHHIKFVEEPVVVAGSDPDTGAPRQELKFIVEEDGRRYRWNVPVLNKQKEPNYLLEVLAPFKVGDEAIVQMGRRGIKNYIAVKRVGEAAEEIPDPEDDADLPAPPEEIERTLAAEATKPPGA
jgi:hypothetical protein